jgi:hypothetical protein
MGQTCLCTFNSKGKEDILHTLKFMGFDCLDAYKAMSNVSVLQDQGRKAECFIFCEH